jgi:hypothetical protein
MSSVNRRAHDRAGPLQAHEPERFTARRYLPASQAALFYTASYKSVGQVDLPDHLR